MEQTWGCDAGSDAAHPQREQRVVVVSDHGIIRHGLRLILSAATTHVITDDPRPIGQIRDILRDHRPDVVIADVSTVGWGEQERMACLARSWAEKSAGARMLLLCAPESMSATSALRELDGVVALSASDDAVQLLEALRTLLRYQPAMVPVPLFERPLTTPEPAGITQTSHVTPREREVIELITQGLCSKRIARALNISVTTVRTHRQRLMSKLGLRNSVEVAQYAAREFGAPVISRSASSPLHAE